MSGLPQPIHFDAARLQSIRSKASSAELAFMQELSGRQRAPNHNETSIEELVKCGETRAAAVQFFKELETARCGEFKTGRRGKETRFIWSYSAIDVAHTFLDETLAHPQRPAAGFDGEVKTTPTPVTSPLHEHCFLLRPSLCVTLALPLDMTAEEANRLSDFIKTLPF